jgi:fatty-acyl-CoA synthase
MDKNGNGRSVPALIDSVARRTPEALALALLEDSCTYAELVQRSVTAARSLRAAGVRAGDRVAFLLADVTADQIALLLGTLRLGAITAVINARFKARELTHALTVCEPRLIITAAWFADQLAALPVAAKIPTVVLDGLATAFWTGDDTITLEEVRREQDRVGPDTPARIVFTSGTTAQPKGCLHTHGALVAQAEAVADRLTLTAADRYWTPLPMFHTAGWTMLAPLARGASFHHPGRFTADSALRQIRDDRCTVLFPGFETIWMAVLTQPDFRAEDLPDARLVLNVGSPERMRVMQRLLPHAPQVSNTGCTECSGWLAIGEASDSPDVRAETCGRVLAGMHARIIDPDTGRDLPDGSAGELIFRGPSRLLEYYRDPEGTAAAIKADGWFHTGDLVVRRPDGMLQFMSRLKDMLKVGGENVAAAEIEDHLITHPAVHIAQVVSAPDAKYTEVPAAFIELTPGATTTPEELIAHCQGHIASFKIPRYIRFVTEWPMSGTKIKKTDLRSAIAAEQPGKVVLEP